MHILIIAPEEIPVPPLKGGSVEICIEHIAKRMAKNHQVTVVSRQHEEYPNKQKQGNLTYIRVPVERKSKSPVKTSSRSKGSTKPPLYERYIKSVIRRLRGKKFDWIQIDNRPKFVPFVKTAFPRTPISLFLHSLTFVDPQKIDKKEALECLSRTNLIIANSESTKKIVKRKFPKLASRIKKVWLGVDDTVFRPPTPEQQQAIRQKYKIGHGYTILFAGRIIPRKGIDVLIKAVRIVRRKHPSLRLVIAGNGKKSYTAQMKQLARKLRVPAYFIGKVPHRNIHEVYWMADCFVCPSQEHESFGLVNVEAMASGVPLIASRIGGIQEIVKHQSNGLLVQQYRSPVKLARYIEQVMTDKKLAERLKLQARKDVKDKFNWEATVSQLIQLYNSSRYNR